MYSVPERLVHACLHVTEQVWHPMHLSRFITMAICAMTLIGSHSSSGRRGARSVLRRRPSVLDLLGATADDRHLVALVPGRAEVVEREGQLGVAADEVARLDQDPGQRVVDPAAPPGL